MSEHRGVHFSVVVIGSDPGRLLAPFNLAIKVPLYPRKPVERTHIDEVAEQLRERGEPDTLEAIAKEIESDWTWAKIRVHEGELWEFDTINPRGQWDFWRIGGGWRGFFPLRPGVPFDPDCLGDPDPTQSSSQRSVEWFERERRVDIATVEQIDFEGERDRAEAKLRAVVDPWLADVEMYGRPLPWTHFEARMSSGELTREEARAAYDRQPAIAAFNAREGYRRTLGLECPVARYGFDPTQLIARARAGVLVPYAIVHEGEWRANPFWSGGSSSEPPWDVVVADIYASLPEGTRLTAVDCHR